MAEGTVKMAKIKYETKEKLKAVADNNDTTMTELIKEQLRLLLRENGLPTI